MGTSELNLDKYDKNGMYKIYDKWPELADQFFKKKYDKIDFKHVNHIVFCGMGGSGAVGDVLSAILSKTRIHSHVVKGYHLPNTMDSNTLVVAISASGATLETLTVLKNAKNLGSKTIAFSSGGTMEKYCDKNKIEYRKIPVLNSPRASFVIYLYSILNVLDKLVPVKKQDIVESITSLTRTQKKIGSHNLISNPSLELAKWMTGIPIIYYPMGLQAAAIRFKNSIQENVKTHAIAEDVIEACHNGIVAWETASDIQPVLIQGKNDFIKTKELWKVVKEYLKINKIDYKEVYSVSGSILTKIMDLIYLLDYASIYSAVLKRTDPTPVKSINFVKKRLHY